MWIEIVSVFHKYMGTGLIMLLFLAALVYLFLKETKKERRILFVYMPLLVLLLYFNPLFSKLFCELVGSEIYFRICWLLPITPVLGYTAVSIVDSIKEPGRKAICLAVLLVLIPVSGKAVYENPLYSEAENIYHVPDSVVHICDAIKMNGREVVAAFPEELFLYVRQYSPYVCLPYGRTDYGYVGNEMFIAMERDVIDLQKLQTYATDLGCHYFVVSAKKEILGDAQDLNLEIILETDGYLVYRNHNTELIDWVTELGLEVN